MHALRPERALRRHGWRHDPQPDDGLAALLDVAALAAREVPSMRSQIWAPWQLRRDTVLMTPNAELTGARRASELNAVLCGNGSEVGAGDTAMKGKQ